MRSPLFASALILCMFAQNAHAQFSDIPVESGYSSIFTYLEDSGIIRGFNDGTARPHQTLSRVEGLATALRSREQYAPQIVWFTENLPNMALFSDMTQTDWFAPYVEVGFLEGVITGVGNGELAPGSPLTVEQAVTMLYRAYGKSLTRADGDAQPFNTSDRLRNTDGQWFTDAVSWAIDRNLIPPNFPHTLGEPMTRGAFATILYRLHSIEAQRQFAFVDPEPVIAYTEPSLASARDDTVAPINEIAPATIGPGAIDVQTIDHEYASDKPFAITIPSLDLMDIAITHPENPFDPQAILEPLKYGLGHLFAYPGNPGKTMIFGHSSSYAWDLSEFTKIFRQINRLVAGERVYVTFDGQLYIYEVTHKQVIDAKDVSPFNDNGTDELILYTCWPPDDIKQRYLVHAAPIETVALR